jgi:DNA-binding LacI/PurR family transcriptional regulator
VSAKQVVVKLRTVADRVGLAPCSVSAILNQTPASQAIPKRTQDRVFRAAAELNYQPNVSARSLRTKRTHMVALLSNDFARADVGYFASRIERILWERGYLLVLGSLDSASEWPRLSGLLRQRGVEGLVAVGIGMPRELTMAAVSVHIEQMNENAAREPHASALSELAESATDALLRKIESGAPGKAHLFPVDDSTHLPEVNCKLDATVELG